MKVILYMAISIDGFIATKDGQSDWVSEEVDVPIFEGMIKNAGGLIVSRKTLDQYYKELYPMEGVLNIVVTKGDINRKEKDSVFVSSPGDAVRIAKENGLEEVVLVGGGDLNGSFLKEKLIDEIFVDVHPLILGDGVKLFGDFEGNVNLQLIDNQKLDKGNFLLHYQVSK